MGCDGGTIPRRDELVKVKKKPETKDKDFELAYQWRYCHLSQQPLQTPIVMCGLGYLYNKVTLIEALLDRASLPDNIRHIKNLKDVKNLNLTPNPEYKETDEMKEGGVDSRAVPYICPVIGLEMTGKYRFIALWSCGCVFSERALKEISTNICHKCQKKFIESDIVVLNGNEEDLVLMRKNLESRQQKNKLKKDKPATITSGMQDNKELISNELQSISNPVPGGSKVVPDKACDEVKMVSNTQANKPSASSNKIEKLPISGQLKRKTLENDLKNHVKKVKGNYSVAKDPQASDVYKSLFTSHQSEQQQNRAHWITYNPFYN